MSDPIVDATVSAFVEEVISLGTAAFSSISDSAKAAFKVGIQKYLDKQKKRYSQLKTLLRGNTPVDIYDVYYQLDLMCRSERVDTSKIAHIFEKTNFLTIIGDAGSGKSTLIKHLFINAIDTKFSIPVLIELRYMNDFDGKFDKYIVNKILEAEISENEEILGKLLKKGSFVFFFDGYDELKSDAKKKVVDSLNNFINLHDKNRFILTSRPFADIELLPQFTNARIRPLSVKDGDIGKFIDLQLDGEREIADKIKRSIDQSSAEYIREFLINPLLLTLYILSFQSNSTVPDKKYIFYRRVINALFYEHDSKTKLGFVREICSGISQEQIEEVLKVFCFLSYFEGEYEWDHDYVIAKLKIVRERKKLHFDSRKLIGDLKLAVALWVEDGGKYAFAHRSLQEYFTALFIKELNPLDNQRVYPKIIESMRDTAGHSANENLLSLLEEMDNLNFHKYYSMPVLGSLRKFIDKSNSDRLITSFVQFFAKGVTVVKGRKGFADIVRINYHWTRMSGSFYLHLQYTDRLNKILRNEKVIPFVDQAKGENVFVQKGGANERRITYHFDGVELSEDPLLLALHDEILPVATEFSDFIDRKMKEISESVDFVQKTDQALVDMIGS